MSRTSYPFQLTARKLSLVLTLGCFGLVASFSTLAATVTVSINDKAGRANIVAELIDEGDYYYGPQGEKISFFRKKDIFAITPALSGRSAINRDQMGAMLETQFAGRVDPILRHSLGKRMLVRLNKSRGRTAAKSKTLPMSPESLSSHSLIGDAQPVLANSKGQGDILISSKVLFKLAEGVSPSSALDALRKSFGLTIQRRIQAPGFVYSAVANAQTTQARFALARRLSAQTSIQWAQPQFVAKGFKHSFEPLDPLYSTQWHLQNKGFKGSRCDTDCDANNAWDLNNANGVGGVSGAGMVIAIVDDGVQLNHEDLSIWENSGEVGLDINNMDKRSNGVDDDGNGYIDDWRGWDFVDDSSNSLVDFDGGTCVGNDGVLGPDNNPNPQPDDACGFNAIEPVEQDNHGTAVAGLAAAQSNNNGVVGAAFSAQVLALRLISDFDGDPSSDFCARVVEAMTYAGRYADVINNSWGMEEGTCPALDEVMGMIADGTLTQNSVNQNNQLVVSNAINISKRANIGSPIIFSAGNSASGWVKVTVDGITSGEHAYEWRVLRSDFPSDFETGDDDVVYLDDIQLPGGQQQSFEGGTALADFTTACTVNNCTSACAGLQQSDLSEGCPVWEINTQASFVMDGSQSAQLELLTDDGDSFCAYSYLSLKHDGPAGSLSFWVWVNTDLQQFSDKFEFLIDGREVLSYGDLSRLVDNQLAYPANSMVNSMSGMVSKVIAVGASNAGDLSGLSTADTSKEERSSYSQYGAGLDLLAPSDNQHLGIYTTDRYGPNAQGYNPNRDIGGSSLSDPNYTDNFGGTSASAPIVAGIAATIIASDPGNDITAAEVEEILKRSADKIGRLGVGAYSQTDSDGNTRSDFYGYGRVNMFAALQETTGFVAADSTSCTPDAFSYSSATDLLLPSFAPQATELCAAEGPLIALDELCFPILTSGGSVTVLCL